MNIRGKQVLAAVSGIAGLVLIAVIALHPVLYLPPGPSSTEFHADPGSHAAMPPATGGDIKGLISDLIDTSGAITLSVKVKDLDAASRDLKRMDEISRQFESVVIQLDLSESDIGSFQQLNRENLRTLAEVINDTGRFEQLKKLEVTYRESEDPSQVTTLSYEGASLSTRIRNAYEEYQVREPEVVRIGENLDISTDKYQQGTANLRDLSQESGERARYWQSDPGFQGTSAPQRQATRSPGFSCTVVPDSGTYGDSLVFSGSIRGGVVSDKEVVIFIDGLPALSAQTDGAGLFSTRYRVEMISAGGHTAYAREGETLSPMTRFSILQGQSLIALSCGQPGETGIPFRGSLSSGALPVRSAPVTVLVDSRPAMNVVTGPDGTFDGSLAVPSGTHRVSAFFDAAGFPLQSATSSPVTVVIGNPPEEEAGTGGNSQEIDLYIVIGTGLFLVSAMYLLRSRVRKKAGGIKAPPDDGTINPGDGSDTPARTPETGQEPDSGQLASAFLSSGPDLVSTAAYHLLGRVVSLASLAGITRREGMTARELVRASQDFRAVPVLEQFVRDYERIRYAGEVPDKEERHSTAEAFLQLVRFFKGDIP